MGSPFLYSSSRCSSPGAYSAILKPLFPTGKESISIGPVGLAG